MTRAPGRPKSNDPKRALTIRLRSSLLAGFDDTNAARAAIEALVEARFAPGLRSELAKALDLGPPGWKAEALGLRDRLGVQVGPTRSSPGSLLDKKGGRTKR